MTEGNLARGKLIVTDQRLLFAGSTLASSQEAMTLPWSQVTSVEAQKNLMTAHVVVTAAGKVSRFMVKYADGTAFAQAAQDKLAKTHSASPAAPASSTADELAKLAALLSQGVLTADEFTAAKARLLG